MKKTLLALLIATPIIANAGEVNILSSTMLNIPDSIKQDLQKRKQEQDTKGYYETNSDYAGYLLNLKKVAPQEIKSFRSNPDAYDTHLKSDYKEIKLAFPFKIPNGVNPKDIVGYAAAGGYVKKAAENHPEGWTGIGTYFTSENIGSCGYSFFNLALTHGGVDLNNDFTTYRVNKKASTETIEGNHKQGFVYSLSWYTKDTMSKLECANLNFDKEIMNKMVILANKIDKQ
ncbi:MAG TPA: hypothetical protein VJN02_03505 [Gammaproteobacteria bacterium]|nr:hypothetical protein [Gammaproteobacteria bacterium]